MSISNSTSDSPLSSPPEFFSAHSGAELAGVTAVTVRNTIEPDAVLRGHQGKHYPLFLRTTLEAYWASREIQLQAAPEAHDAR
jgi:hypothetical protein